MTTHNVSYHKNKLLNDKIMKEEAEKLQIKNKSKQDFLADNSDTKLEFLYDSVITLLNENNKMSNQIIVLQNEIDDVRGY
jgi:hypothetical protein